MPRKRDISPGMWRSDQFLRLSANGQLTWIAMFSLADDLGVGLVSDLKRHTSLRLKVEEVVGAGLAVLFAVQSGVESRALYFIPTWCRHQYVSHPSRGAGLPLPPGWRKLVAEEHHHHYAGRDCGKAKNQPSRDTFRESSAEPQESSPSLSLSLSPSLSPSGEEPPAGSAQTRTPPEIPPDTDPRDRALIEAVRAAGIATWSADPKVTPTWAAALRAAFPTLDGPAVVRRCAVWWLTNPGRVKRRRGAVGTLKTFFEREPGAGRAERGYARTSRSPTAADIDRWASKHAAGDMGPMRLEILK